MLPWPRIVIISLYENKIMYYLCWNLLSLSTQTTLARSWNLFMVPKMLAGKAIWRTSKVFTHVLDENILYTTFLKKFFRILLMEMLVYPDSWVFSKMYHESALHPVCACSLPGVLRATRDCLGHPRRAGSPDSPGLRPRVWDRAACVGSPRNLALPSWNLCP